MRHVYMDALLSCLSHVRTSMLVSLRVYALVWLCVNVRMRGCMSMFVDATSKRGQSEAATYFGNGAYGNEGWAMGGRGGWGTGGGAMGGAPGAGGVGAGGGMQEMMNLWSQYVAN